VSGKAKAGKILDRLTGSASTKYLINQFIKEYGHLTELRINRSAKSITATLLLSGESRPIDIYIEKYAVIKNGSSTRFIIRKAESQKPWLDAILNKLVIGRSWLIPEDKAPFILDFLD